MEWPAHGGMGALREDTRTPPILQPLGVCRTGEEARQQNPLTEFPSASLLCRILIPCPPSHGHKLNNHLSREVTAVSGVCGDFHTHLLI